MASEMDRTARQKDALRKVLVRQKLRLWASKAQQERQEFSEELLQLFTSSSSAAPSSLNGVSAAGQSTAEWLAQRPITRRPGVEEVRNCLLASDLPCIPRECGALRGEIWQVLLNVYKRNQHGSAAQEFERMIQRLGKLPRDPLLVEECESVSQLIIVDDEDKRQQVQSDLEILLVWFLTTKSVKYATGMARVVAVFFQLNLPLPTVYDCFYQFCASFLPHFVSNSSPYGLLSSGSGMLKMDPSEHESTQHSENSGANSGEDDEVDPVVTKAANKRHERQQLAEQLLGYHEPQLAHFLSQWCPRNEWSDPGRLVPQGLFLDDVYNAVEPSAMVYVVDQYLLTGDGMFGVFLIVAALIDNRDDLMKLRSIDDVHGTIKAIFAVAVHDPTYMEFLCMLASRLRSRTPTSYKCALHESKESFCGSRQAATIAFDKTTLKAKSDVDMTQWQKRESRSFAGKVFWYHLPTGRTQWEHPAEEFDPPPSLFALPISVNEVAPQVMGEKRAAVVSGSTNGTSNGERQGVHFFVVDCRGLRSSEDLKSGRIPASYTLDPSVFDSPELIERSMGALDAMKSLVHIVLVGNGVGLPPEMIKNDEIRTSVRDAVRHDIDSINRAALFFQKRGFRFISCLDGGYSSWHAFVRDDPVCSPQELLCHVEDECHYCRYDTILRTGEDPMKKKQKELAKTRRKKSAMPTTTTMLVNGGEGDASIVSTNPAAAPPASTNSGNRRSITSSLSLGRTSIPSMSSLSSMSSISNMRSKLSDVKMPKLAWRRGSSATSVTTTNQSESTSESTIVAAAEDAVSDRGSSTNDEGDAHPVSESGLPVDALSPKLEKSFVGVFTIDYSDDEDEDEQLTAPVDKDSAPTTSAGHASVPAPSSAPTLSA